MKVKLVDGREITKLEDLYSNLLDTKKIKMNSIQSLTLESESDAFLFNDILNKLKNNKNPINLLTGVKKITITGNNIFKRYDINILKNAIIKSGLKNIDLIQYEEDNKTIEIFSGVIENNKNIKNRSIENEYLFISTKPIIVNEIGKSSKLVLADGTEYSDKESIPMNIRNQVESTITQDDELYLQKIFNLENFYKTKYENSKKLLIDNLTTNKDNYIDKTIYNEISSSSHTNIVKEKTTHIPLNREDERKNKIQEKMKEIKTLYDIIKNTSAIIDASVAHELTLIDNSKKLLTASVTEEKTKVYKEFIQDSSINYRQKAIMILSSLGLAPTNEELLPEKLDYNWKNNAKIDLELIHNIEQVLVEYRNEQQESSNPPNTFKAR